MGTDAVTVAALNATVLSIYEVVLGLQLSTAAQARSRMIEAANEGVSDLNSWSLGLTLLFGRLSGKSWSGYETNPDNGPLGFHFKRLAKLTPLQAAQRPDAATKAEGELFVDTVVSIAAQYPFPTRITALGPQKRIELLEDPQPLGFHDPSSVEEWFEAIHHLQQLTVDDNPFNRVSGLIAAAALGPSEREAFDHIRRLIELLPQRVKELRPRVLEWRARRSSRQQRTLLVGGLLGGAVMFVVGVLMPLIWQNGMPYWTYALIPALWYAIVVLVVTVVGLRRIARF